MELRKSSGADSGKHKPQVIDMIVTDNSKKEYNESTTFGGSEGDVVKTYK